MRRREAKKGKAPSQKEALNDAEKDDLSPEEAWTTYGVNVSPSKTTKTRFVMAYRSRLRPARQQKQTDRGPANHVQVRDPGTKSRRADAAATAYAFTGPDTDSTDDDSATPAGTAKKKLKKRLKKLDAQTKKRLKKLDEDDGMSALALCLSLRYTHSLTQSVSQSVSHSVS